MKTKAYDSPLGVHAVHVEGPERKRFVHVEEGGFFHIVEDALPDDLPGDTFDLIIFSEIGYYFERDVLTGIWDPPIPARP